MEKKEENNTTPLPTIQEYFDIKSIELCDKHFRGFLFKFSTADAEKYILQWAKEFADLVRQKALEAASEKARIQSVTIENIDDCLIDKQSILTAFTKEEIK